MGVGGAVLGGINALMQGKGLPAAALAGAKGFITPGSGVAQGINMAGNLMQNSQNPALQNVGNLVSKGSNLASMFGLMRNGGKVKLKYAKDGMNTSGAWPPSTEESIPRADFLLNKGGAGSELEWLAAQNEAQGSRADRASAFGTASTDVYMPVGDVPVIDSREPEDVERTPDLIPGPIRTPGPDIDPVPGPIRTPDPDPLPIPGPYRIPGPDPEPVPRLKKKEYDNAEDEFDMEFIFDQTPLPRGEKDVRYSKYQKTMGVKDPKTGKYYYIDAARGFTGPKGKNMLSISSLPEAQRARALKAIQDQEMKFAGQSDYYRRQRGL